MEIILLVGLPGSGKTTFAKEMANEGYIDHINLDEYNEKRNNILDMKDCLKGALEQYNQERFVYVAKNLAKKCIIDGLFLTNNAICEALNIIYDSFNTARTPITSITIEYWNENKAACIINDNCRKDRGERQCNATGTIKYAPFEKISKKYLSKYIEFFDVDKIVINEHEVETHYTWQKRFLGHLNPQDIDRNKLHSSYWTTGGIVGNCWNSNTSPINPEDPIEFIELDELLIKVAPKLTYQDFLKIKKECVCVENDEKRGYYGTMVYRSCWTCHLPTLFEMLCEMGYL